MGRRRGDENAAVGASFEDEDAAGGWRPPRVPSMSSEASEVLFGTKKRTKVTDERVDKSSGSFAGFDSPGEPSGSFAG